jgi:hypothetical protein
MEMDSKFLVFCCLQTTLDIVHYWQIFAKFWPEGYEFDIYKEFVMQKMA